MSLFSSYLPLGKFNVRDRILLFALFLWRFRTRGSSSRNQSRLIQKFILRRPPRLEIKKIVPSGLGHLTLSVTHYILFCAKLVFSHHCTIKRESPDYLIISLHLWISPFPNTFFYLFPTRFYSFLLISTHFYSFLLISYPFLLVSFSLLLVSLRFTVY